MINVNAIIQNADVHFLPELDVNQIELTIAYEQGKAMLRLPMNTDSMCGLMRVFNRDSLSELKGEYCRLLMDEMTGRVASVKNIMYDSCGELYDNPVA